MFLNITLKPTMELRTRHILKSFILSSDSKRSIRLVPKLTEQHIHPSRFQKMKVKLATQVFSASVAAAMNTNMALEGLPASAHATIELIMNFDKFFDIFNSSQMSKNRKEFNLPFMGSANRLIFKGTTAIFPDFASLLQGK